MQSYASGPAIPLIEKTIGEVLADSAARNPAGMAVISRHQGLRISYTELLAEAERTARGLWGLGLRPGDRAGIWSSNCAEWVYLQLATALIGVVLVTSIRPTARTSCVTSCGKSGMKAIFLRRTRRALQLSGDPERGAPGAGTAAAPRVLLGDGLLARDAGEAASPIRRRAIHPDDVVNIQYTSGTTGSPKGVLLTHRNLVNNA